jgi:hypothetical protein
MEGNMASTGKRYGKEQLIAILKEVDESRIV